MERETEKTAPNWKQSFANELYHGMSKIFAFFFVQLLKIKKYICMGEWKYGSGVKSTYYSYRQPEFGFRTSVGQMMPLASIAGTCAHSHTQSHIHTHICILIIFFTKACPENLKM